MNLRRCVLPSALTGGLVFVLSASIHTVGAQSDTSMHNQARELTQSVAQGVEGRQSMESARRVEGEIRKLDSLPRSVTDEKLFAHGVMVGYYQTAGMPELVRYHARAMIALAQELDPASEVQFASIIFGAYQALADLSALEGRPREAEAILSAVPSEIVAVPTIARSFAAASGRYGLIGSKMPPIAASNWIGVSSAHQADSSAPIAGTSADGNRRATIVEFTAYWCAPCQDSYDYLKSLRTRFANQPVDVILVTSRMGEFRGAKHLTKDEETRKLSEYFTHEQRLPFPVAVTDSAGPLQARYYVDAYPEIVVENGSGEIVKVLRGWSADTPALLTSAVSEALK